MSNNLNSRPLIGKGSNCGTLLGVLFLVSLVSIFINIGLFILLILCQATIVFLDATRIRAENNDVGPEPILYGMFTIILWIVVVPLYIYNRNQYADAGINSNNRKKPVSQNFRAINPNADSLKNVISKNNQSTSKNTGITNTNHNIPDLSRNPHKNQPKKVIQTTSSSTNISPIKSIQKSESNKHIESIQINQDKEFVSHYIKSKSLLDLLNTPIYLCNEGKLKEARVCTLELIDKINGFSKIANSLTVLKYSSEKKMFLEAMNDFAKFGNTLNNAIDSIEKKDSCSVDLLSKQGQEEVDNAIRLIVKISNSIEQNGIYKTQVTESETSGEIVPSNQVIITWAGDNNEIRIHNYLIINPLIYWTNNKNDNCEASCINLNLPIGKPISEPKGALGYWPRYSSISPDQRANYLLWLSSGRYEDIDIGYIFLFFYGLEYRALIEKKDIPIIIDEVVSLLKKYPLKGSFNSYLSSFLAYIAAQQLSTITENNFSQYFPNLIDLSHDQALVAIAWHIKQSKTISWELAYSLANTIPDTPKSVITQKLSKQFKQLFETKFRSKYPEGIKLEPSLRNYKLEYRPASPSLIPHYQNYSQGRKIEAIEISNPLGKKSQFNDIFSIWVESIEELKPASRKVGKGEHELTAQAYQALPDSLKQELDHPEKSKWDKIIAESKCEGDSNIIPISSLAVLIEIEKRDRLTPTQSKLLFSTARDVGYVLIPDPRITGTPYRWDDPISVYPLPDKRTFTSESYPTVAFILELGMSIALIDGKFSPEEQDHLDRFIFGSFELTPLDVECLKQYQHILIQNPPLLEKLGTRLKEHLTENNKLVIAEYLRDMASADGFLEPNEYKALNKIFKTMGLGKDDIRVLFPSNLTSQPSEQPIQISCTSSTRGGEPIFEPVSVKPCFTLNPELLEDKFNKTREIQKILGDVIRADDDEFLNIPNSTEPERVYSASLENVTPIPKKELSEITYGGLHPKYFSFIKDILIQSELTKPELQGISRRYGFMADAAIEDINTWSEEKYGDFLFDEVRGDVISINSDIKAKIQENE